MQVESGAHVELHDCEVCNAGGGDDIVPRDLGAIEVRCLGHLSQSVLHTYRTRNSLIVLRGQLDWDATGVDGRLRGGKVVFLPFCASLFLVHLLWQAGTELLRL